MSNKLKSSTNRISSLKARLDIAQKLASKFASLENVNISSYNFILSQMRTQFKKPNARRFTLDDKIFALSLLKASGKAYRLLSKVFSLPSKKTLGNLLNKIPLKPGIQKHLFEALRGICQKMKPIDRNCVLLFDEMSIETFLSYSIRSDEIMGIEDLGGDRRRAGIADHATVFMIKGLFRQWKQPICYVFTDGPLKSQNLVILIKEIISECNRINLTVTATICDQGNNNQAAINKLLSETEEYCLMNSTPNRYFGFLVDNREVVPLYDTPHLFKGLRNNLLTKHLHFLYEGKACVAKWRHIEQLYQIDTEDQVIRVCPKLTDNHVLKEKIRKMKVSYCTQVFSHQVGALLKKIVSWGNNRFL